MQTDQNYEAPRRKRTNNHIHRAEKLGDLSMADHMILNKEVESRNHRRNAVFGQDLADQWIQIYLRKRSFKRNDEKLTKVLRSDSQSESDFHGIWHCV